MSGDRRRPTLGVMEGHGFYALHSEPQHAAADAGLPWLERAVDEVPLPADGEVVIADYGVAGGRNSIDPVRRAIDGIRARAGADQVMSVVHTDVATNDFNALFELLASADSYLHGTDEVYASVTGGSFYQQLLPAGRVHIGWSAIAVHWLSAVPTPIPDHIYSNRASGGVHDAFARQAAQDWRDFLDSRARELVPGGKVVVIGGATDEDGLSTGEGLMDMANDALGELVAAGTLTVEEHRQMTIPTYNRTMEEYAAAFDATCPLQLEAATCAETRDPMWEAYQRDGDIDAYARAYADFFRAAFGPSLVAAVDVDRDAQSTAALFDEFYRGLRMRIAADPATASCRWLVAGLLVAKPIGADG